MNEAERADRDAANARVIARDVAAVSPLGNGVGSLCTAIDTLGQAVQRLAGVVARLSES